MDLVERLRAVSKVPVLLYRSLILKIENPQMTRAELFLANDMTISLDSGFGFDVDMYKRNYDKTQAEIKALRLLEPVYSRQIKSTYS